MSTRTLAAVLAVALAFSAAAPALSAERGSLEGRWRLIEQTYGSGNSNLVDDEPPLRIEFRREGERLVGRTWIGDERGLGSDWPSLQPGDSVIVRELVVSPARDRIRARYRPQPAPGVDPAVELVEDYRIDVERGELVGTVTVIQLRDGSAQGSYTLRRRFEREP